VWLEQIVEKLLWKHRVQQVEVREVLAKRPRFFFVEKGHRVGEDLYAALGQTDAGRYLIVFFIYTKDRRALILSARNMTDSERNRYERK
jgi:uncharacterized DUF497 family protein